MKNSFLLIVVFSCTTIALQAQNVVNGYVFEDGNGNGKKEHKEKALADVAVSNGREVTLTNKHGEYQLPVGQDNPIFVIKPTGYDLPVNVNNLPQFYYLYKPAGSPDLKFKGVEPTGKLPKSIDFGLIPSKEKEKFTALIFGDPQTRTKKEVDFFMRGIVSEVEGIDNVTFGLSLGDLVWNDLSTFDPYIQAVKRVGIPWFNVMGNHDRNFDVKSDSLSDETFEAHFGPANYAFNYGKVHFIILDNILYPDPDGKKAYGAGLREDQLDFIENDLKFVANDDLVVLAYHIPLVEVRPKDKQRLFELLGRFPHTLTLSAHTHIQRQDFFTKADGWQQENPHHEYNAGTTCGSWYKGVLDNKGVPVSTMRDGTPKGYAFINFDGNKYEISYKVAGYPANYQMNIFTPKVVQYKEKTSAGIYVNFFMGDRGDEILYRIDEGKWNPMAYEEDYDPSYLHILDLWDFADELLPGMRPPGPLRCTHLWRANIATDLSPGEHTLEVKATDMYGRAFIQSHTYRIAEVNSTHN